MRPVIILFFILVNAWQTFSQVTEPVTPSTEQQLENSTAHNNDRETEDDAYLQQLMHFLKDQINLNTADAAELNQLHMLTALQISNFLVYRKVMGKLVNLYELQAIPGWHIETIQKIAPYITVSIPMPMVKTIRGRLVNRNHSLLIRASQVPERARGYLLDSSTAVNFYPGSAQQLLFRYAYNYKNLLQFGILAEKDAGEQFFKGKQKQGFDFYSAHIFARQIGLIKALAIGDYTVNMGQGLIQWQSLAFKKSADVIQIKRESAVLGPYNSAGENNFHRGIGITLQKRNWQLTFFGSYKNSDANLVADTVQGSGDFISSLQTSGYHRTKAETADKSSQHQLVYGGNLSFQYKRLQLGINGIQYTFKLPLIKAAEPYNTYALAGKRFGNYSIDYSYTFKNLHFFGEAAFTSGLDRAFINGLMISTSSRVDVSLLYRKLSKS